jgi:hypothetical protein
VEKVWTEEEKRPLNADVQERRVSIWEMAPGCRGRGRDIGEMCEKGTGIGAS